MTDKTSSNDIPAFLRRNPDNSVPDVPVPRGMRGPRGGGMTDEVVTAAVMSPAKPDLRAEQAAIKKRKSYARIGKMKATKADREAVDAGKTWDPTTAKWV